MIAPYHLAGAFEATIHERSHLGRVGQIPVGIEKTGSVMQVAISGSVGRNGINRLVDQAQIIFGLNHVAHGDGGPSAQLTLIDIREQVASEQLISAIVRFQEKNIEKRFVDGLIDKDKRTLKALNNILKTVRPRKPHPRPPLIPVLPKKAHRVNSGVAVMKQPTPNCCWATLSTMFVRVRRPQVVPAHLPPKEQIRAALGSLNDGASWVRLFEDDEGMPSQHLEGFFRDFMNFTVFEPAGGWHEGRTFRGGAAWLRLIQDVNKNLLLATRRPADDQGGHGHIVTVTGIDTGRVVPNQFAPPGGETEGVMELLDTNPGTSRVVSIADIDFLLSADAGASPGSYNRKRVFFG
ncbi:hypothetical protein JNW90_16830 [Micromonospora sp. STR1s_5]|nr:hypothetical protein [Micromonospora sp. STR1s_5]